MEMLAAAVHPGPQGRGQAAGVGGVCVCAKVSVPLPSSPRTVQEFGKSQESSAPPCTLSTTIDDVSGLQNWLLFTVRREPCVHAHACIYIGRGT